MAASAFVNMASRAGQCGYPPNAMANGASTAALINLTKAIALSHRNESVISVALAPRLGAHRDGRGLCRPAWRGRGAGRHPIGRMAAPEEIGKLTAFPFRPSQASLNGTVLDINGGIYLR